MHGKRISYLRFAPCRCKQIVDSNDMPTLTKRDLVTKISNETGLTQGEVFSVIQKTLDGITDALAKGNGVELRNFGVFEVKLTKPRIGRNPNAPEKDVPIPERATVKFKAGKVMRELVLMQTDHLKKTGSAAIGDSEA